MPFLLLIASLFSLPVFASNSLEPVEETSVKAWPQYPADLPQFDYSGDKLQKNWQLLSAGTRLPWPSVDFITSMMKKFPVLSKRLHTLAKKEGSHPALKPILKQDYEPLSLAIQQVWRLHYQGQFEQAYNLGMQLGPAGLLPALYSKLIHTTFLITDADEKEEKFIEVESFTAPLITHAPNFSFLLFGDAYQKARRLELMSTTAATASGLLGPTQEVLQELNSQDPENILYSSMLAGIDAGIIERVGGFIGGMTYGADEEKAVSLFDQSVEKEKRLAVIYNEFALMLIRLDDSDYDEKLDQLLATCISMATFSAEEALNQNNCKKLVSQRQQES